MLVDAQNWSDETESSCDLQLISRNIVYERRMLKAPVSDQRGQGEDMTTS